MAHLKPAPPDYFTVVGTYGGGQATSEILCFTASLGHRNVYLHMMEIRDTEINLDVERFTRFSRYRQSCRVTLTEPDEYRARMARNGQMLDWVDAHTHSRWSLFIDYRHMFSYDLEWSFESSADAIMFKLTWG